MDEHSAPIKQARLANLDAIRGLGVLGIFFLNIYFMGNSFFGYAPHEVQPTSDIILLIFSNFFLEGRFFSLFAMIFGVGMLIQYQRQQMRMETATTTQQNKRIKSRLYWLIAFGVIHAIFIFPGDILLSYGVSGLLAFRYISLNADELIRKAKWFIFLSFIPIALISLMPDDQVYSRDSAFFIEQLAAWTGSYQQQLTLHLTMFAYMLAVIPLTLMWYITGLMLLGMALYKRNIFVDGLDNKTLWQCVFWAITLASLDSILSLSGNQMLESMSDLLLWFSAIATALIYIHIIVKFCQNTPHRLKLLQNVGRMAFSLYILQSIVGILLLRYIAPDWLYSLDRIGYVSIAIIYSVFQLLLADVYLRKFNQGPLEKLWRVLVSRTS
ncbi:DUF418 domain-containing protein [Shewanella sp. BF02_Schw]|jgi:uncharacterized protein|uniref:DUF418 domain-containing protein n=1 Tax=Shewanella sp. BF02_Schw TaxID=394908 RepID=UPI001785E998|nr:DUF418 domain-containing protein [Shewanella sp. BF02_Schw]MBO1894376.1 DUF418 domain-containing protein [Shewanella sp. BF02_Schw]